MQLTEEMESLLQPFRAAVKVQGDVVRSLKSENAPEIDVKKAVAQLKSAKKVLEDKEIEISQQNNENSSHILSFDRSRMEDLLRRRFFYDQSFAIYGGVSGQYDFGPMGCAIKNNVLDAWRKHFAYEEQMMEVDCSRITPEDVLKASGHVEKFADFMVKDVKNGECFRLDHLIRDHVQKVRNTEKKLDEVKAKRCDEILNQLDGYSCAELWNIAQEFDVKSPLTQNEISEPMEFNLMFQTMIGPTGLHKGYLRPETAQGIFVNFKRLLEFNQGRLPFAAFQIGNSYRNEIAPRSGLLRVREFTMAEIEHFCDPIDKEHPKFEGVVRETSMFFYSATCQMDGSKAHEMTIGEAVDTGIVANPTLGYFLSRIHTFCTTVLGLDPLRIRYRQHMSNEMAHYACDCWDMEVLTSYGWIECVGCADRSAFDLKQHADATGVRLCAEKRLDVPVEKVFVEVILEKGVVGKAFKGEGKIVMEFMGKMGERDILNLERQLKEEGQYELKIDGGKKFTIKPEMIREVRRTKKMVHIEEIVPNVVEPSFGIGRILYSLFEHSFRTRENDEQRTYFSLLPNIAPIKCVVLPLSNNVQFIPVVKSITSLLNSNGISYRVDDSAGSIGRRYTRNDELAIPFAICVDFDSLNTGEKSESVMTKTTVTLRERDSTSQVRLEVGEIVPLVQKLCGNEMDWCDVMKAYPIFEQQESTSSTNK